MSLILGAAFLAAGILLFVICYPKKDGQQPAFLKSDLLSTNIPVVILSLLVLGIGLLYAGFTS